MPKSMREALPPVYRHVLPAFFDRASIEEPRATCDDCAMCGSSHGDEVSFAPSTKCCTFHPQLPNYLVGALLDDASDEMAEGRRRVRARIRSRSRVTPRWLAPSRKVRAIYRSARHAAFGRSEALLCPYFDAGACTVWRYRESYCSSFFCKHESGEDGRQFWRHLREYLDDVEAGLAQHLAAELAPELVEPEPQMTIDELEDRPPNAEDYSRWWGRWEGREEDFYRACAARLASMGPADFERALKSRGKRRLPLLEASHTRLLTPSLPESLRWSSDVRSNRVADGDGVSLTGYSAFDPLVLPEAIVRELDGIEAPEPIASLLGRLDGDRELLERLYAWRLLVDSAS